MYTIFFLFVWQIICVERKKDNIYADSKVWLACLIKESAKATQAFCKFKYKTIRNTRQLEARVWLPCKH